MYGWMYNYGGIASMIILGMCEVNICLVSSTILDPGVCEEVRTEDLMLVSRLSFLSLAWGIGRRSRVVGADRCKNDGTYGLFNGVLDTG